MLIAETLFNPTSEDVASTIKDKAYSDLILVKQVVQDDLVILYFKELDDE